MVMRTYRCQEDTQSDYVSVISDHVTGDHVTSGQRMCDPNTRYSDTEEFLSDSNSLLVEFCSNDVYDATGFNATYQFYSHVQGTTINSEQTR